MRRLTIYTKNHKEVVDITEKLNSLFLKSGFSTGTAFLSLLHTTCALTICDLDPGTDQDYLDAFNKIVPKLNYRHPHDPGHMSDHILSSLIGTSLTIPVQSGNIILGTYQKVVLLEFNGPGERNLNISFSEEKG